MELRLIFPPWKSFDSDGYCGVEGSVLVEKLDNLVVAIGEDCHVGVLSGDESDETASGTEFLNQSFIPEKKGMRLEDRFVGLGVGIKNVTMTVVPFRIPWSPKAATRKARTREAGHTICPVRSQSVDAECRVSNSMSSEPNWNDVGR